MADGAPDEPSLLVERHGGVARIVPNRPARLDAFDDAMHVAPLAALERARDERAVRAKALALIAVPVSAARAADRGMIWQVHPDGELADAALALAAELAAGPAFGLGLVKRAIQDGATRDRDAQLDAEAAMQGRAGRSADHAERVAAFLGKRAPAFTGEPPA